MNMQTHPRSTLELDHEKKAHDFVLLQNTAKSLVSTHTASFVLSVVSFLYTH